MTSLSASFGTDASGRNSGCLSEATSASARPAYPASRARRSRIASRSGQTARAVATAATSTPSCTAGMAAGGQTVTGIRSSRLLRGRIPDSAAFPARPLPRVPPSGGSIEASASRRCSEGVHASRWWSAGMATGGLSNGSTTGGVKGARARAACHARRAHRARPSGGSGVASTRSAGTGRIGRAAGSPHQRVRRTLL